MVEVPGAVQVIPMVVAVLDPLDTVGAARVAGTADAY